MTDVSCFLGKRREIILLGMFVFYYLKDFFWRAVKCWKYINITWLRSHGWWRQTCPSQCILPLTALIFILSLLLEALYIDKISIYIFSTVINTNLKTSDRIISFLQTLYNIYTSFTYITNISYILFTVLHFCWKNFFGTHYPDAAGTFAPLKIMWNLAMCIVAF